jgi:hypothetical protein
MLAKLFLIVLLIAVPGASRQPSNDTQTGEFGVNGRFWKMMPTQIKQTYIYGAFDMYRMLEASTKHDRNADASRFFEDMSIPSLNNSEIEKELDKFYLEPVNAPIPIVLAIKWVAAKAHGASQLELDAMEASARKLASATIKTESEKKQ